MIDKNSLCTPMKMTGSATFSRTCLRLDLKPMDPSVDETTEDLEDKVPRRRKPLLDFRLQDCNIDPTLRLEQQSWYHGCISRSEAESLLYPTKEGSFLVRTCDSRTSYRHGPYSIAIKSAKGYMHLKIVRDGEGFVLGVFSQAFQSIPQMIYHYSMNRLPIRGAEHMSLRHPVPLQLL